MKKHSLKIFFKIFWLMLVWLFKFHFFMKYFSNDKFIHELLRQLWVVAISTTRKYSFMPVKLCKTILVIFGDYFGDTSQTKASFGKYLKEKK